MNESKYELNRRINWLLGKIDGPPFIDKDYDEFKKSQKKEKKTVIKQKKRV